MSAADASSLILWSALSLLGLKLVIVGVVMEGAEVFIWTASWLRRKRASVIWNEPPEPHIPKWAHRLDHIGWFILVIGLALETWGHIRVTDITGRENLRLTAQLDSTTRDASQANERISTNELAAKQLEIKLNETKTQLASAETRLIQLKIDNLPMDIGNEYSLGAALKSLTGIQVELRSVIDLRAEQTADNLDFSFALGSWRVINRSEIHDFGYDGVIIEGHEDEASQKAAKLLLKLLTDRGVPAESGNERAIIPFTNTILVAIGHRPSATKSKLMIVQVKFNAVSQQISEIFPRIIELARKRFAPNSKELDDAQTEYNDLNLRSAQLLQESRALEEQQSELNAEEDKEIWGTNSMAPGVYMSGNSFNGLPNPIAVSGTNANVDIRGERLNVPPLQ